ncbi:MAG: hypothetical protein J7L23_00250 [Candidatus Diapherotrites archaeon]|nr:hypothetical protein [Candidatus Diapherotrites archaeon]
MELPNPYETPYYKYYILIALVIFAAMAFLALQGTRPGIDLTGGTAMTAPLNKTITHDEVESFMHAQGVEDVIVRITEDPLTGKKGIIVEFTGNKDIIKAENLLKTDPGKAESIVSEFLPNTTSNLTAAEKVQLAAEHFKDNLRLEFAKFIDVDANDISVTSVGSSIGKMFWESSERALLLAFILVAAIVFVLFRQPVPSIAVIQAIIFDMVTALAGISILQIPVTLPTIAALLMILGYSIDSDIMVTDKIMKRSYGSTADRAFEAMKTGLTMTGTTLVVLGVLVFFSYFSQMTALFQISAVLFFGLLGDLPSTYLINVVIVKWWTDKKQ